MTTAVHNVTAILLPFPSDDHLTLDVTDNLDPADMPVSHLAAWLNKIHQMHDTDLGYMIIPPSELSDIDVRNDKSPELKCVNSVKDKSEPNVATSYSKTGPTSGSHHYVCKDAITGTKATHDGTEIKTDSAEQEVVESAKDQSELKLATSNSKTVVSSDSHHYVCKDVTSDNKTTSDGLEIQKDLTKVDNSCINHPADQNDNNEDMEYFVTCLLYDLESQNASVELDPTPTRTSDIQDTNTTDQHVDELDEKTTEISETPTVLDNSDQQTAELDETKMEISDDSDQMVKSDINTPDQQLDELHETSTEISDASSDNLDEALAKLDDEIPNLPTIILSDIPADPSDQQVDGLGETSTEIRDSPPGSDKPDQTLPELDDKRHDSPEDIDMSEADFEEATSEPVNEDPDTSFQTESSYYSTVSQDQKKVIDPETVQKDNQTDPNSSDTQTMDITVNDNECQFTESGLKSTQTDTIDTSTKSFQATMLENNESQTDTIDTSIESSHATISEHNESQTDAIDTSTKSFQATTAEHSESQTDEIQKSDEGSQVEQVEQLDNNKQQSLSEHQGSQTDRVENLEEGVQVSGPDVKSEEVQVEGLDSSLEECSDYKDTDSLYTNTECSESQTDISGPITLLSDVATSETKDNRYGNDMDDGLPVDIGGCMATHELDNRFAVDSGKTLETHTVTVTAQSFRIKQENLSPAHRDQNLSDDMATVGKHDEPDTPVFEEDIIPNTNLRHRNVPNILQSLGSAVGSVSSDEEGGVFPPILDMPDTSSGQVNEHVPDGEAGAAENEAGEAGGSSGFLPDLLAHPDDSFSGESHSDILSSGKADGSENVESSGIAGKSESVDEPDTFLSAASGGLSGETKSAESASFAISGKAQASSTETLDDVKAKPGLAIAESSIDQEIKQSEPIIIVSHPKQDALDWCCRFFVPLYVLGLLFLVLLCLLSLQRPDNRCCFQNAFKHSFQLMLTYNDGSPPI